MKHTLQQQPRPRGRTILRVGLVFNSAISAHHSGRGSEASTMSFDRMDQMDWTYGRTMSQARRGTIVGQVMGLLAFSLLFTAGGYLVGRPLGFLGMIIGLVGALATVL